MNLVPLDVFLKSGPCDERSGIYHIGNGLFELRCTPGIVEFQRGTTCQPLPAILTLLAAKGVRRLPLEWDSWQTEQINRGN